MLLRYIDAPPHAVAATLDRNRKALRRRVAALRTLPDAGFADGFTPMVAAAEAAFRREEILLEALGSACPPARIADHATWLRALHCVMSRVEDGDVKLARELVDALDAVLMLPWHAALAQAPRAHPVHHRHTLFRHSPRAARAQIPGSAWSAAQCWAAARGKRA